MNTDFSMLVGEFIDRGVKKSGKTQTECVNDFCEIFGVSYSTAYKWIADKKHVVIRTTDEDWFESRNSLMVAEIKRKDSWVDSKK
ncbi:hypothetical protein NVP1133O_45 [Vibrio phage 1.133.O._10N.222.51.E4]|nr:hypothetical protein NVP1133O_45 [Vibrio phage 1.133.O._10N.222.51.E4]